jgi:type II secretory pathway pseudopilin PulG
MRAPRGFVPAALMNVQIAVMAVLVIVAILAPFFFDGKARRRDRERFSSALSALVAAQTAYHASNGYFARSPGALGIEEAVRAPRVVRADSAGWTATMESDHTLRPRVTCGVFDGPASYAPDPVVTHPREVACWGVRLWVIRTRE